MDPSAISLILKELNLHEDSVVNIYNHGSWVYGTNTPESDRDLIIVTRSSNQKPIRFHEDFDYFHQFELHKLWNQYDVCVYSVQNFEILLEKNYLAVIQCLFLSDEFKLKEEIDFRRIYLEKYFNPLRLKQVASYEMFRGLNLYDFRNYPNHPRCSSRQIKTSQSRENYIFKNLFHGIRYLNFVEQLLQTRSIYNYKRATHIFDQMKDIRRDFDLSNVAQFVREKAAEYKSKLDTLVPTNNIKGAFEAHITFDCADHCQPVIQKLRKVCRNTKYKIIFIQFGENQPQQLMVSSQYNGEYPSIVKQIEEEAYQHFKDFNIIRIKIKSSTSNEGVPRSDLEKRLFWDDRTTYFEFRYKMLLKKDDEQSLSNLQVACHLCMYDSWFLSRKGFIKKAKKDLQYMITMRSFDVGQTNAFRSSNQTVQWLTERHWTPLKVIREFIVYDTNIELDNY